MISKTLIFLDNTYPGPYDCSTVEKKAIGGTESSVVKTAQILSKKYNVVVIQKYRFKTKIENDNLIFAPKSKIHLYKPDFIIILRKYPLLKKLKNQFPKAKLFLWLHTYKNTEYVFKRIGLANFDVTIICNSKTHREDTKSILNENILGKIFSLFTMKAKISYCYNPITRPESSDAKINTNKLIFFSSPNKGLKQVVSCFSWLNKKLPNLRLYIANPGYKSNDLINQNKNIIILGSLPHKEIMKHVRESLCVFYPQNSFAETFGLIYAEANSYGVPVMAHDIGSAKEILDKNNYLIDVGKSEEVYNQIKDWQINRPSVSYNDKFSSENILKQWLDLLI